jgi:hypothetical protein
MKYFEKSADLIKKYIKPIYIAAFLIFFVPRIIGIGSDISNYDASYWYPRSENFTSNLLKGDYNGTYQQYHPGVVLMLTSGTSLYTFEELYEKVFHYDPTHIPQQFIKLQIATIFPLVLMISALGTLIFFYLKNILNTKFAIIFIVILSLEPFFLGISKFFHLSALTSMFMFASFLTLYYYYFKESKNRFLFYFSAILLALGTLTKIDAVISAPVNIALIFISEYKKVSVKTLILNLFLYGLVVCTAFYVLFPAMWVASWSTVRRIIFNGIQDTAFDSNGGESFTHIKALYYFETYFLRSLPTSFFAFIAGLILLFVNRKKYTKTENNLFYWILGYLLFNVIILTIPEKTKDRYLINLYPPMLFVCAIAFYELFSIKAKAIKYSLIVLISTCYIFALYRNYPVYSFYYSELIGGPSGITKLGMSIKNRGEYYAQAAQYINESNPNAGDTNTVIAHRESSKTFDPFYYGKPYTSVGLLPDGANVDYIVSRPDLNYLIPEKYCKLEKTFGPKDPFGYQEVFVYRCEGLDNSYKNFRN